MCLATVQKAVHEGSWNHGHLHLQKDNSVGSVHVRGVGRGAHVGWWARIRWDNRRRYHGGGCNGKSQDLGPQMGGEWQKSEWIGCWGRAIQGTAGDAVVVLILGRMDSHQGHSAAVEWAQEINQKRYIMLISVDQHTTHWTRVMLSGAA